VKRGYEKNKANAAKKSETPSGPMAAASLPRTVQAQ
jgi:hypothetical protein